MISTTELISVGDAIKKGVSGLIKEAEQGHKYVVLRNSKPVAAVISMRHLEEMQRLEDDFVDLSTGLARLLSTSPQRHSLDQVLAQFGYTREDLRELTDTS